MLYSLFREKNFSFLYTPLVTWFEYVHFWQFCWSQFYIDEIFSRFFTYFLLQNISKMSTFFLDRWFSFWTGKLFFVHSLSNFSNLFSTNTRSNYNFFLINLTFFLIFLFLIFASAFYIF